MKSNGYSGTTGTKLRSDATGTNYDSSITIEIDGSPDYAGIICWDLSSIPVGKTVTAVNIAINVTDPSPQAYEIYALRRAWDESQATWQRASSGTN